MKYFIHTTLILGVFLLFSQKFFAQHDHQNDIKSMHAVESCAMHKIRSHKRPKIKSFAAKEINIIYQRMYWEINPAVLYINGAVTTYFEAKSNFSKFSLELDTALTVDSVIYNNQNINFYDSLDYFLVLDFPTIFNTGDIDSVVIYYQGAPGAGGGFGSFIKSTHDGVPVIWTLSEPYGAKEWWPNKNDLSDKIDSCDIFVRTPKDYRAAANGLLVNEITDGNDKVYHWKHRYPIATYLVAIAVTNYAVYSDWFVKGTDSVEVLNYVFPEDSTYAVANTPQTLFSMNVFDSLFTDYPFKKEKYGHAQFGWGGGMEHQTMSFMGNFSFGLIAHELAHQWFGDMITLGSWKDIWLNEGFATYLTGLTYESMPGTPWWGNWKQQTSDHVKSQAGGSVYCDDTTSVGRIFDSRLSYNKGAYVLHMLRWVCGDSAFFAGVNNYLNDLNHKYKYAYTDDLKNHLELASGLNLTEFFNDWYYGQGFPTYSITATQYNPGEFDILVSQSQSHSSVSFFEMPIPIRFKGNNIDTIIVFENNSDNQLFQNVNLGSQIDTVEFDPDIHIVANSSLSLVVGIEDINDFNSFEVFPNPVINELRFDLNLTHNAYYNIYNSASQLIKSSEIETGTKKLRIERLSSGIYFIEIISNDKTYKSKFIVE